MWRKRRSPRTGRGYLYVSDEKIDAVTEELRPSIRERFGLGFNAKHEIPTPAGTTTFEVEAKPNRVDAGQGARIERLCAALEADDRLDPDPYGHRDYFRGEMIAVWGFWNREDRRYADVVFFTGFIDERVFVGIGGSAYNTSERQSERLQQWSNSGLQQLMRFMEERTAVAGRKGHFRWDTPDAWDAEAWDADHDNPLVPESIEYVANRLRDSADPDEPERHRGRRTIIGSPIYVSRTGTTTPKTIRQYERLRDQHMQSIYKRPRLQPYSSGSSWQVGKPSYPILPPPEKPRPQEIEREEGH